MDENATELNAGDDESGKYKVEAIRDSAVYARESESGCLEKENTWKPASAVQYFKKSTLFYKDHPDKSTAIFKAIDTAPLMAKPTVKPTAPKQKQGRPTTNSTNKRAKKN